MSSTTRRLRRGGLGVVALLALALPAASSVSLASAAAPAQAATRAPTRPATSTHPSRHTAAAHQVPMTRADRGGHLCEDNGPARDQ